jgi:hypothetical protein
MARTTPQEVHMDRDELTRIAAAAGLPKLDGRHLQQLANSIASARELGGKLPKDLHWTEELSLVFRLPAPTGDKR